VGCTDCGAKGGCDTRKDGARALLDEAMARVYPDRTWGRPDDAARFRAGVPAGEGRRLGRRLATLLRAPTWFRAGAPEDLCDFVWVLCVGRRPALIELHDGGGAAAEAGIDACTPVEERYLRVALSSVARIAAVQEVTLTLAVGAAELREAPRPGVFDPVLLARMRKTVALLEASSVAHVDFGLLDVPVDGAAPGDYAERYGAPPRLVNFLFYAAPAAMVSTVSLTPPVATAP
jgi:hypothetical protein